MKNLYRENSKNGAFIRPDSEYRFLIKSDGSTPFLPEHNRYHLYVCLACPWSQRTLIVRKYLGLEKIISISITQPIWGAKGWHFGKEKGTISDFVNHKKDIIDIYHLVNPKFRGEETVPILWDKKLKTIVNNESRDIMRMFNEFSATNTLCPSNLKSKIDSSITDLYESVCNGVYKAGFAETQKAYDQAFKVLFKTLDRYEKMLSHQKYVCGKILTEADVALYVTLVRFDMVYYSHFKCNQRAIREYPNLWRWLREVYSLPAFKETTNFTHIKKHYYGSHKDLNPLGIIPLGPAIDFRL